MTIALLVFIPELPRICSRKPLEPASAWFFVGKYAMWLGIPFVRRSFYTARLCQATRYGSARLDEMHVCLFIPSPHTQAEVKKNKKNLKKSRWETHTLRDIRCVIASEFFNSCMNSFWRFATSILRLTICREKRFVSACLLNVTCTSVMQRNTHCKCSFVLGKRSTVGPRVTPAMLFAWLRRYLYSMCKYSEEWSWQVLFW